jgi:hypothetical protein
MSSDDPINPYAPPKTGSPNQVEAEGEALSFVERPKPVWTTVYSFTRVQNGNHSRF